MDLLKIITLAKKYNVEIDIKFDPMMREMRLKVHKGDYHRAMFYDYDRAIKMPKEVFAQEVAMVIQDVINTDLSLKREEEENND